MNIDDFIGGWLVGRFKPSLVSTSEIEVGIKRIPRGTKGDGHYHKQGDEHTIILTGKAMDSGCVYADGGIITIRAGEKNHTEFLEDSLIVCIKEGSGVHDKYYD